MIPAALPSAGISAMPSVGMSSGVHPGTVTVHLSGMIKAQRSRFFNGDESPVTTGESRTTVSV